MDVVTRREAVRKLGAGAALLTLPSLLAACGGGGGGAAATTSGAEIPLLRWHSGAVPSLDVATGFVSDATQTQALALEALVTTTPELELTPALAESWSQPDPLRYVYTLREGVAFWDGTPLSVEDVVYSIGRHIDPDVGSQIASYYLNVKSVKATGPNEVTIFMKAPDPLFQYVVAFSWIMPKAFSERLGRKLGIAAGTNVTIMGTGPYRVTSFNGDTGLTLERNERYHGPKPLVRKLEIKLIPDTQAMLLAMRSGEVDGAFNVPIDALREWERLRDVRLLYPPPVRINYLSLDVSRPPFDDLHVRRAIAYALDREGIAKAFFGRAGEAATAVVAPGQWGGLLPEDEVRALYDQLPDYPFDLEKAKAELAQSAHPEGFKATVQYPNVQPFYGKSLTSLSESLKQIGVDLTVKSVTINTWLADIYGHEQQMVAMTLAPDYADPANFPTIIYPSANATKNNFNTANFRDAKVDQLLEQQASTTDKAERGRLIGEVLRISAEQLPYIPITWIASPAAVNRKFVLEDFSALWYYQDWVAGVHAAA